MTRPLFRREMRRLGATTVMAVTGIVGAFASTAAKADALTSRDDVVMQIAPGGTSLLVVDGVPLTTQIIGGSVSLKTDDVYCVPIEDEKSCSYVLNSAVLVISNFVAKNQSFTDPYLLVSGPLAVEDDGQGIIIPSQTNTLFVATVATPNGPARGQASSSTPADLTLVLNPTTQQMTVSGSFTGQIGNSNVQAALIATALSPFVNMPPMANAGPDQTVCSGMPAHLSGSGSTDVNNNIFRYAWSENGVTIASGAEVDVTLGPGTHTLGLAVTDTYGGKGTDTVVVTVSDAATDLGVEHAISTVSNNACLRVTQYPAWGVYTHSLVIQPQATGVGWPIPFTYANCSSNSGSGSLTGPWQQAVTKPVSASCPTVIKLGGNGAGSVALTWWGNG